MKSLLVLIALVVSTNSMAASPKLNEPPFWMPCFEEFHDLQTFQKKYYLRNFLRQVTELKTVKTPSAAKMQEAADWDVAWDEIREKVYKACDDRKNHKACVDLAEIRLKTFEIEEETQFER